MKGKSNGLFIIGLFLKQLKLKDYKIIVYLGFIELCTCLYSGCIGNLSVTLHSIRMFDKVSLLNRESHLTDHWRSFLILDVKHV